MDGTLIQKGEENAYQRKCLMKRGEQLASRAKQYHYLASLGLLLPNQAYPSLIQSWVTSSSSSSSSSLSSIFIRTKYQLIILLICQKSPKIRFWPKSQRHSSILCSLLCVLLIYVLNNNFLSHFIYNSLTFVLSIIRSMTFYMEITQMGPVD